MPCATTRHRGATSLRHGLAALGTVGPHIEVRLPFMVAKRVFQGFLYPLRLRDDVLSLLERPLRLTPVLSSHFSTTPARILFFVLKTRITSKRQKIYIINSSPVLCDLYEKLQILLATRMLCIPTGNSPTGKRRNPSLPSHFDFPCRPPHTINSRGNYGTPTYGLKVSNGNCPSSHPGMRRSTEATAHPSRASAPHLCHCTKVRDATRSPSDRESYIEVIR